MDRYFTENRNFETTERPYTKENQILNRYVLHNVSINNKLSNGPTGLLVYITIILEYNFYKTNS